MKKPLKAIGAVILIGLLSAGVFAMLIATNVLYVLELVVSNQTSNGEFITDGPEFDPVHVEVTIDGRIAFDKDVYYSELESLLGVGAEGDFKWVFLFGKEHTIEVTTDFENVHMEQQIFTVEQSKQFGVIEVTTDGVDFEVKDELILE